MPTSAMDASISRRTRQTGYLSNRSTGGIAMDEKHLNIISPHTRAHDMKGELKGESKVKTKVKAKGRRSFQPSNDKENAHVSDVGNVRIRGKVRPLQSASLFTSTSREKDGSSRQEHGPSLRPRRSPLHLEHSFSRQNQQQYDECPDDNDVKHGACQHQDDVVENMEQDDDELCQIYKNVLESASASTSVSLSTSRPDPDPAVHYKSQEKRSLSNDIFSGRSNAKFLEKFDGEKLEPEEPFRQKDDKNSDFLNVPLSFRADVKAGSGFFLSPRPLRMTIASRGTESCSSDVTFSDASVTPTATPFSFVDSESSLSSSSLSSSLRVSCSPKSLIQSSIGSAFDAISRTTK